MVGTRATPGGTLHIDHSGLGRDDRVGCAWYRKQVRVYLWALREVHRRVTTTTQGDGAAGVQTGQYAENHGNDGAEHGAPPSVKVVVGAPDTESCLKCYLYYMIAQKHLKVNIKYLFFLGFLLA